ncbi:hypothetical protein [Flavobacterium sp.]|uniref:hypothetical protein n=1 Tax=Flavobacterium sp. TaxID=239 RepID=UPI00374FF53B
MKKLLLLFCLLPIILFSQKKQKEKLTVDFATGVYSNIKKWKENGLTAGVEVTFNDKYLIYSTNFFVGFGISKNINNKDGYFQAFLESDILIGKEFDLSKSISIQPEIGIGYLHLTNHFQEDKKHLISLPLQMKILFFNYNDIAVGLIPKVNINNTQNNYYLFFTINYKS